MSECEYVLWFLDNLRDWVSDEVIECLRDYVEGKVDDDFLDDLASECGVGDRGIVDLFRDYNIDELDSVLEWMVVADVDPFEFVDVVVECCDKLWEVYRKYRGGVP